MATCKRLSLRPCSPLGKHLRPEGLTLRLGFGSRERVHPGLMATLFSSAAACDIRVHPEPPEGADSFGFSLEDVLDNTTERSGWDEGKQRLEEAGFVVESAEDGDTVVAHFTCAAPPAYRASLLNPPPPQESLARPPATPLGSMHPCDSNAPPSAARLLDVVKNREYTPALPAMFDRGVCFIIAVFDQIAPPLRRSRARHRRRGGVQPGVASLHCHGPSLDPEVHVRIMQAC